MNLAPAVIVDSLSKYYLLYDHPQDRLKQSILGRLGKNYAKTFWALKEISFTLERGKALGIIGRNGSGKSTLLEIIVGTLQPSSGQVHTNGRVTALLELGAGFNPEFTGRENIYLSGSIMGIEDREISRRSGEIIEFAQIGEYIDQPVKYYSSGMFVRLAFAIATCVEPDILLIDEALAVGDAGFVIKCMNRMKQMRESGATIILVTHDVQTVRSFCDEALWIHEGQTQAIGAPVDVTGRYLQFLFEGQAGTDSTTLLHNLDYSQTNISAEKVAINLKENKDIIRWGSGELQIETCSIDNGLGMSQFVFEHGQPIQLQLSAFVHTDIPSSQIGFGFALRNSKGLDIITGTTLEHGVKITPLQHGQNVRVSFAIENILAPGSYALVLNAENRDRGQPHYYDFIENAVIFTVVARKPIYSLVLPEIQIGIEVN